MMQREVLCAMLPSGRAGSLARYVRRWQVGWRLPGTGWGGGLVRGGGGERVGFAVLGRRGKG